MSNNLSIFSNIKTPYLEAEYATNSPRVTSHLFHYFLGLNQPANFVVAQIKAVVEKANATEMAKLIQADAQNYNWTPLHIAVMKGELELVTALLNVKSVRETILARDEKGWTAFHHASVSSPKSEKMLEELDKAMSLAKRESQNKASFQSDPGLTTLGLSPRNILNYTRLDLPSKQIKDIQFEGKRLTLEKIKEFGMTHFRDDIYFPNPRDLWDQEEPDDSTLNKMKVNSLDKMPNKKLNIVSVKEGGFGLEAVDSLEVGTVIGIYAGEVTPEKGASSHRTFLSKFNPQTIEATEYLYLESDGRKIGNHLRFAQCGLPNVAPLSVTHLGAKKTIYTVVRKINPREPILVNYGAAYDQLVFGPQRLYFRTELREIYKTQGFDQIMMFFEKLQKSTLPNKPISQLTLQDNPVQLDTWRNGEIASFPLCFPTQMLDLHYSGTVPMYMWNQAIASENYLLTKTWKAKYPTSFFYLNYLLCYADGIDNKILEAQPSIFPLYQQWMLDHIETMSFMNLTKAMEWIEQDLPTEAKDFPVLAKTVEDRLQTYDWTADETNIYSYTKRKDALSQSFNRVTQTKIGDDSASFNTVKRQLICDTAQSQIKAAGFEGSELQKMYNDILSSVPQN